MNMILQFYLRPSFYILESPWIKTPKLSRNSSFKRPTLHLDLSSPRLYFLKSRNELKKTILANIWEQEDKKAHWIFRSNYGEDSEVHVIISLNLKKVFKKK